MSDAPFVHVIDDDEAVRDSIRFLLHAAGFQVRVHESASTFLSGLADLDFGCIITDVRMPEIGGIDLLRKVREQNPDLPVIVITGHADVPLAVEAMKIGAFEFIEKPFDDIVLLAAVSAAIAREERHGHRRAERAQILLRLENLSQREKQVLEGLIAGHSNKAIAFDLQISPRTVEIYRANVMTKMEAASLSELVRMALTASEGAG